MGGYERRGLRSSIAAAVRMRELRMTDLWEVAAIAREGREDRRERVPSYPELVERAAAGRLGGAVATRGAIGPVIGCVLWRLGRELVKVTELEVRPGERRRGVGTGLVARAVAASGGRRSVVVDVREGRTGAHLFLRRHGFEAVAVLRGWFADTGEDAYAFWLACGDLAAEGGGE